MVAVHPTISALSAKLDKHTRDGVYDKTCPLDLLAAQVAYLPQLNVALDQIRKEWNRRPIDVCGLSKDGAWSWSESPVPSMHANSVDIQEWSKRGKHPATEPEGIELPREALGHHSAEEFVNYGATGGPYVPCSVHTNRPSSENGESDYRPALKTVTSQLASAAAPAPSPPAHPTLLSQAPLEDIGDIDPCLRLWLEDFPLPKSLGYAGVRAAMGEYIADDFAHVAPRFRVSRDRSGI
jgi:hypothetical protein